MYRSLAFLALPLFLAGCGSSHSTSEPTATIGSFRSSFFSGQQPSASTQLAAMPPPAGGEAKATAKSPPADRSAKPQPFKPDSASSKEAGEAPYKASVAAYIKRYAVDDNSLKLAKIGTPFQGSVNGQKGSVVCVELGGLRGNRTAYLLRNDAVIDSEFGATACRDKRLESWNNTGA